MSGRWKVRPEDFEVVEIPREPPSGRGPYQWLWVEKIGLSTLDVAERIARAARVDVAEVSWAGLKDREARTEQAFTVRGGRTVRELGDGATVLRWDRTGNRLGPGQLHGNKFRIRVRGGDAAAARARLRPTMPNFYGPQRVGGDAPGVGREVMFGRGPRLDPNRLRFAIAAYQAALFNRVLDERGERRLKGDLLEDGVPTGPIYGSAMRWPRAEARALEEGILRGEGLPPGAWERFGALARGARRRVWVPVSAVITEVEEGFVLEVTLPAGSYATVLLERVVG